jgi:signal transduction histidine kinase/PAS domain-containing protein
MWIGTNTDITESRFAREALEREKALLQAVLEQMPAAVWILEAPSGKVIMSNTRAVTAMKQPNKIPTAIEDYTQYEIYHPNGRAYRPSEFPGARAIMRGETITDEEIVFVRPDKSRSYAQVSAAPVRDQENRVIAAVAVALDISKTKSVEEALRTNQERLQKLLAVADAALTQDVTIEGSYSELLSRVKDAFSADSAAILLIDEDEKALKVCSAVGGMEEDVEKKILVPVGKGIAGKIYSSGKPLCISDISTLEVISPFLHDKTKSVMGVLLRTESSPLGVIHIGTSQIREFTEDETRMLQVIADRIAIAIEYAKLYDRSLKNLGELQKEERLREQFVATLSHDLRNPLTAAKTSAELLLKFPDRPTAREQLLRKIVHALDRADRMIMDLLDANRIKAGKKIPIQFFKCDLAAVVRVTLEELSMTYGNRFVLHGPENIHGTWAGDAIRRVVENLCNNAVKYGAKDKSVTVTLTLEKERLLLSVHNFGHPIAPEQQARLFQPFQRANSAETSGKRGWGLGLVLVRGIAEAHGGYVTVHSTEESGTTFTVYLPLSLSR